MLEDNKYCIIITTTNSEDILKKIINTLFEKKLAACIQTFPIKSHYRWQQKLVTESEYLLQIKSQTKLYNQIKQTIQVLHNYDIPEIIMIPIIQGNKEYFKWIDNETT